MNKQIITILIFFLILNHINAQEDTLPFRHSSMPERTPEVEEKINNIPYFTLKKKLKSINDIAFIDNSNLKYFPAIFNQRGNSCSQASGIRYIFSYEMNVVRDSSASSSQNVYSYHYTWNFLNDGKDIGSWYFDGYDLVMDNGVPSIEDFNDETASRTKWMTGYDTYYRAMHNRIEEYSKIDAGAATGLDLIKQYLIDHGDGSEAGGLLNFSGKTSNWLVQSYFGESLTGYKSIIKLFGDGGDHAMTIVGYDDSVRIDVDDSGVIEPDEIGALIIANSWGSSWGDNGKAYMPYKLLKLNFWNGGIGNGDQYVYVLKAKEHSPLVTAKVNITYTSRDDLYFILGVSNDPSATTPQKTKLFKILKNQGGDNYMQGTAIEAGKTIELGLDATPLINEVPDAKKYFLYVERLVKGQAGDGEVIEFSVMDYRDELNIKEYKSPDVNIPVNPFETVLTAGEISTNFTFQEEESPLEIFPNPVINHKIHIGTADNLYIKKIELLDLSGKIFGTTDMDSFTGEYVWDLPDVISGVYIIRVHTKDHVYSHKISIGK